MLSSFLTPILLASGLLLGIGIFERKSVILHDVSVPLTIRNAGYPPPVVSARLSDAMTAVERDARTRPEARRLALQADKGPADLIADYLHLTPILQAMQDVAGMVDWTVSGEIIERGDRLEFRSRIRQRDGASHMLSIERPRTEIDALLTEAALAILRIVDPQISCSALLARALQTGGSVVEAQRCVDGTLRDAERADLIWLINLQGVISFLQNDRAGALNAFTRAVRLDRDFSPALLNIGVLFADDGRHEEAIRAFAQIFRHENTSDSPQTYAAALTEWGDSLLALGRREEALTKYSEAVRLDPRYARSFFRWAEVLGPGPIATQLRQRGALAQGEAEPVYVENLVGIVRTTQNFWRPAN